MTGKPSWINKWSIGIGAILALMVVISVVGHFWFAPMIFEEQRQSGKQIAKEAVSSDNAIQNYRWFRSQWYDIKSQREQLENYRQQKKQFLKMYGNDSDEWGPHEKERYSRIQDRIFGTQNMIESMVAKYNARSSDATRALFKCGLPYNVDKKLFIADYGGVKYTSEDARKKKPPQDPSKCQFSSAPNNGNNEQ